jgi:hypothetical protein
VTHIGYECGGGLQRANHNPGMWWSAEVSGKFASQVRVGERVEESKMFAEGTEDF